MAEEDLGEREPHSVAHHLALIALAAVEEQRLPFALYGEPGDVPVNRRGCGPGPEEGGGQHGGNEPREA